MNGDFGKVGERGPDVRIIDILFLCTIPYPYQLHNYLRVDTHRVEKGIWNGLKSKLAYAIWISPELTCQFSRRELLTLDFQQLPLDSDDDFRSGCRYESSPSPGQSKMVSDTNNNEDLKVIEYDDYHKK